MLVKHGDDLSVNWRQYGPGPAVQVSMAVMVRADGCCQQPHLLCLLFVFEV
jgi:hypothetical protein